MAGIIATIPKYQFSNALGIPLTNGTLTTYLAGTTTLTSTWQDQALTALNTNPVVLDARGECVLWLDSAKNYKFVLKNAAGVVQWTQDNLTNPSGFVTAGAAAAAAALAAVNGVSLVGSAADARVLAASGGASSVGWISSATGAVTRTVLSKLRDDVSAKDFGAVGDGVADDTVALQKFADHICLTGKRGHIPAGKYKISSQITFSNTCHVYGDGWKDVRDMTGATTRSWASAQIVGTIIYAAYTSAASPGTFHFTGNSCVLRDIEFEALQPLPGAGWVSNNTPYAISTYRAAYYEQGGNGLHAENIMLRNYRHGIHMQGTSRGVLRGIYGQCFGQAIGVTQCADVLRIEDVHLNWPFYSSQADVTAYMNANADALVLGRVDNPIVSNFFTFGGRSGIMTYVDTDPTFGGKTERFQGTNIGLDNVTTGLYLIDTVTMAISNIYVFCRNVASSRCIYNPAVIGGGQVPIRLSIVNGDFQGSYAEAMRFEVPGAVQLSNITIRDYNNGAVAASGIVVKDGVAMQLNSLRVDAASTTPVTEKIGTGTITGDYTGGGGGGAAGVSSLNARTGAVTLASTDVSGAGGALLAGANFTGKLDAAAVIRSTGSTLPTAGVGLEMSYSSGLTSSFLTSYNRTSAAYADLTVAAKNITFQSGTAGAVAASFDASGYLLLGYSVSAGAYKLQVSGDALVSGNLYCTTQPAGTSSTLVATTAFVAAAVAAGGGGGGGAVSSFNTRTGAITLSGTDVTAAGGALLAGAAFSGKVDVAAVLRATGSTLPTAGVGLEMSYVSASTSSFLTSYNRTTSAYADLTIAAKNITFQSGTAGAVAGSFNTSGYFLLGYSTSAGAYKLQVSGDALVSGKLMLSNSVPLGTNDNRAATAQFVAIELSNLNNGIQAQINALDARLTAAGW